MLLCEVISAMFIEQVATHYEMTMTNWSPCDDSTESCCKNCGKMIQTQNCSSKYQENNHTQVYQRFFIF